MNHHSSKLELNLALTFLYLTAYLIIFYFHNIRRGKLYPFYQRGEGMLIENLYIIWYFEFSVNILFSKMNL